MTDGAIPDFPKRDTVEPVPAGHVACIVTHLEMRERPKPQPFPDAPLQIRRLENITPAEYRALFKLVGAPWLWFSRLVPSDEELAKTLSDSVIRSWIVEDRQGEAAGMLELDFSRAGECEILYFGLVPALNGKGHGRWLMAHCLALAWAGIKGDPGKANPKIERVWLHTCTLDHPAAVSFYRKQGFVPVKQEVEIYPDPRVTGALPMDSAPQIPIFRLGS